MKSNETNFLHVNQPQTFLKENQIPERDSDDGVMVGEDEEKEKRGTSPAQTNLVDQAPGGGEEEYFTFEDNERDGQSANAMFELTGDPSASIDFAT